MAGLAVIKQKTSGFIIAIHAKVGNNKGNAYEN